MTQRRNFSFDTDDMKTIPETELTALEQQCSEQVDKLIAAYRELVKENEAINVRLRFLTVEHNYGYHGELFQQFLAVQQQRDEYINEIASLRKQLGKEEV